MAKFRSDVEPPEPMRRLEVPPEVVECAWWMQAAGGDHHDQRAFIEGRASIIISEKVMEKDVNEDKKKQRGIFLNIMILLLIIGDLQIPYFLLNSDALKSVYGSIPSWYPIYAVLGLMSNIAIIIGMWKMKKWAIYVLAAYFVSKILVDLAYISPDKQIAVFATTAIGAGLWFWAIYRKRSLFD